MTPKQVRFAAEYIVDLNAAAAARRAGYSARIAKQTGAKLLRNEAVVERIRKLAEDRDRRVTIDADRVLTEYARIAFGDVRELLTPEGQVLAPDAWPDHAAASVASVKTRVRSLGDGESETTTELRLWSKTTALRAAAEHMELLRPEQVVRVVIGGDEE